jgi:hypothetical protein
VIVKPDNEEALAHWGAVVPWFKKIADNTINFSGKIQVSACVGFGDMHKVTDNVY